MPKLKTQMSQCMTASREKLGLSQKAMAERLDVYQSIISGVECGTRITPVEQAAEWARKMRVDKVEIVQIALEDIFRANKIKLGVKVLDADGRVSKTTSTRKVMKKKKPGRKSAASKQVSDAQEASAE
jgi:predicted transcriptional regulator